jgi:hypothetical protein
LPAPQSTRAAAEGQLRYGADRGSLLGEELRMPLDLSTVNWTFVGLMTLLAFVAALLGNLVAFRNRLAGAIIAAVLFAVGFIAWNYYPHSFGLPIIKTIGMDGVPPNP